MDSCAQQQFSEAVEARECGEWDRALGILRQYKDQISPALLSYVRGRIWEDVGHPWVASFFFGHASESDPTNANYRALYMITLAESDPDAAGVLAKKVLDDPERYAPVVVAEAANIRFGERQHLSDAESAQAYRDLIRVLEENLTRIEAGPNASARPPGYEMTVGKLGLCHELLGNSGAAVDYFSRGLRANPNNDGLLVARGILQYGVNVRAVADFEQAVRLGSNVAWPYLFLAHYYLATNRFEECRAMCESGLRMRGSHGAKSQLQEWRAIAEAALGFPPESVRGVFEEAIRLDPSNETALRNARASKTPSAPPALARRYGGSERPTRQFGSSACPRQICRGGLRPWRLGCPSPMRGRDRKSLHLAGNRRLACQPPLDSGRGFFIWGPKG